MASRHEDMSSFGKLELSIQDDGDIVVHLAGRDSVGEEVHATIEFCTLGSGGGRSKHTRAALIELMAAIERDNQERPIIS